MSTLSPLRRKDETMLVVRSTPPMAPTSRGRAPPGAQPPPLAAAAEGRDDARRPLDALYGPDLAGQAGREAGVRGLIGGLDHVVAAQRGVEVGRDRAEGSGEGRVG